MLGELLAEIPIERIQQKLADLHVIYKGYICFHVKHGFVNRYLKTRDTNMVWRCPKCQCETSIYKNSIFYGNHIKDQLLIPVLLFTVQLQPINIIHINLGIGYKAILHFAKMVREKMQKFAQTIIFTDEQATYEIDESHFAKRKYGRGKEIRSEKVWILGITQRGTNKVRFFDVGNNRTAYNLIPIIEKTIPIQGVTIMTDCWKAYDSLVYRGYLHFGKLLKNIF